MASRTAFRLIGAEGVFDVEIQRIDGGALEVAQTDDTGRQKAPIIITHSWDEAREKAALLINQAILDGSV